MRQFTMNIQPDLLLAAKRHALESGINLSDLVRSTLAREIGWTPPSDEGGVPDEALPAVFAAYSEGRVTRRRAMQELGWGPERTMAFAEAMNVMGLPWPTPDPDQIDAEARLVVDVIEENADED